MYPPSIWSHEFIESIDCNFQINNMEMVNELEKKVMMAFDGDNETGNMSTLHLLELIDTIENLGLGYRFQSIIRRELDKVASINGYNEGFKEEEDSLHAMSLRFRLLRQHGYNVSQDFLWRFKDSEGGFIGYLQTDRKGLLSLYEASYLAFEGEMDLHEAKLFATKYLLKLKDKENEVFEYIDHALELPSYRRMFRLHTKWYINAYSKQKDANGLLLNLATLDFNIVQSLLKQELQEVSKWWRDMGLARKLGFIRDRLMECYFWAVGTAFEPQYSSCRVGLTKIGTLITTIDDIYDVYGSQDEHKIFTDAVKSGNETDYRALLSFKSKITQDPYQVLASWNHSFHFCDWSGISCGKRNKRVIALRIDSKGLEGSLSPHVGNLSFLRVLYLKNNSFQGTIPHELGRLSRLRGLGLHVNKFSGVIPTNLSGCSNLEKLWLSENNLSGSIPKELSLLSKLADLVIHYNKLTGGISPFLGNITSMKVFSARGNPLGGNIPDTLGHWKSLTEFYCAECSLYGSIPHSIFNLSLLRNFSLPDNHLIGSLPSEIGVMLPNLEWLQLRDNELTGVLPPSICNCSKLRTLEMNENRFSGKLTIDFSKLRDINAIRLQNNNLHGRGEVDDMRFVDSLINCSRLVELGLFNCNLIGLLPISIGNLSNQLDSLYLGGNQLFGSLPSSIGNLVSLTTLDLQYNQFNGKIPNSIGKLQKLQLLSLVSNQFSGPIPDTIGNLSLLNKLHLDSNKLEGLIPSSIGNCEELIGLNLAHNRLSGKIPKQLLQLPSLTHFLLLSNNSLSGSIPSEIKDLKMLSELDLSYNNLSGNVSSSLGECISLTKLNLRGNRFQGVIPSSFSSLGGLEVLDISQNNLSGRIPQFFDKWKSLEYLNLSFNDFEGEVPAVGMFANASAFSISGNNRLCGGLVILELPKCKEMGSKKKKFPFFILFIVIAPTLLIVLYVAYLLRKKKHNSEPSQSFSGSERFMKVSYNQLLTATGGFSVANLIGEGGSSSVYKGILDFDDDKPVAIKVLHLQKRGAHKGFLAECKAWQNIRHRNVLKIITSCSSVDFQGNDFKALVYEFMPKGSVHDWLHSRSNTAKLNLLQRINILKDVATALDYLHNHCQTTIVHGDLKPSNILLDDDMVAHVGDFGLARLLGTDLSKNSSTGVKGTIGYAPPEYGLGSEMTSSGDVYSFGILLLEMMTGKMPTDDMFNDGLSLHNFACMAFPDHVIDVIDGDAILLQSTKENSKKMEECFSAIMKIGVSCSADSPAQRMKIEIVVNELQRILNVLKNMSGEI